MNALAQHAEQIARTLLGEPNKARSSKDELRFGNNGSLAVVIAGAKAGTWFDHERGAGGGMAALIKREINGADINDWLRANNFKPAAKPKAAAAKPRQKVVATYIYRNAAGHPAFRVLRWGPKKTFSQQRYDPATGKYVGGKGAMSGVQRVPYLLDQWSDDARPIYIAEGEKDCDNLAALGLAATCNPGGAGKFSPGFAPYFQDREVIVLPDNDQAGRDHAAAVVRILDPVARSLKVVELPGLADKGDVSGWFDAGGTLDQLQELVDAAPQAEATPEPAQAGYVEQHGFRLTDGGIYMLMKDAEGNESWEWFASRIEVVAETRSTTGEAWGRLLRIRDRDAIEHHWAMPMSMLAGDGVTYREQLLSLGAALAPGRGARNALHNYLSIWRPSGRARCVERTGWHGRLFVMPDAVYGQAPEPTLLQAPGVAPQYDIAGSLDGWKAEVAALAIGNTRLAFAISAAFAAALLYPATEESGGVHFHGPSSTGKTTIGLAAASVWGIPKRTWRMTTNAAESTSRGSCDALLLLDEIGQAEPWDIDAMAYLIGNESGKARMKRDATARETLTWRTLFLSTGEVGLLAKLVEIGRRPRAGQAMRLIEVPSDAGAGLGCFERLHGHASGDALARHLKLAADQNKGYAARAFVEKVAAEFDTIGDVVAEIRKRWTAANVEPGADGQVLRAAGRFALIVAAGELAQMWGIVPWSEGEADRAAVACFRAWLTTRGGSEPQEIIEGLAAVRKFIEEHGNSRFENPWEIRRDRDGQEIPEKVINRAGFRRSEGGEDWEYFVLPEAWKREVCKGFDHVAIARAMVAKGWMQPGDGSNLARRTAVPRHGKIRLYSILPAFIGDDR